MEEGRRPRVELYPDDGKFLVIAIEGHRVEPIDPIAPSDLNEVVEALGVAAQFVKLPWSRIQIPATGSSAIEWDRTTFIRIMSTTTRAERAFARAVVVKRLESDQEVAKSLTQEIGYEHTWRNLNGVKSGWTRVARSWRREPLFVADDHGRWGVKPKYEALFLDYFKARTPNFEE